MDIPRSDESKRAVSNERRRAAREVPAVDRADLLWTLFGAIALVTFVSLVLARG